MARANLDMVEREIGNFFRETTLRMVLMSTLPEELGRGLLNVN